ncbi:6302_t:CDS:1 [Ambispora leptoticha]|uniref:6302_t:CDS:1 n=1 Tax=Ambispora leptoticha TaxID=144679 RepID=A0A9N9BCC7_9GLOM|nr:6302_t:CDS:1 [Ambispora leptoticha]
MSVCSTGFYWHIVLKKPWPNIPSLKELCYAKYLETDVIKENFDDFGLKDALTNEMLFKNSVDSLANQLPHFTSSCCYATSLKTKFGTLLFTSSKIEGLFNKWDLKTHPNMTNTTQQAKMLLAVTKIDEIQATGEQLRDIRKENRITYKPQDSAS